jgi:hypothetical protein
LRNFETVKKFISILEMKKKGNGRRKKSEVARAKMSQEAEEQIVVAFKKPGAGRKQKARLRKKIVEDEPETEADQEAETEEGEDDAPLGYDFLIVLTI